MSYAYDPNGNQTSVTDPRGNSASTSYDELNRPLIKTDFANYPTRYSYSEAGRIVDVTDARNISRSTEYDGLDRIIRQSQGDGGIRLNSYDANGNNVLATDARGFVTAITYDVLDRPTTIVEAQGSAATRSMQKVYDRVGNLIADIDGRNLRTDYTYDDFNQLVSTKAPAPLNYTQSFSYDKVGNKLTDTDRRGNTTSFAYDNLNRLITVTDPAPFSLQTLVYTYDNVGNRLTEKDKRGTLTTHVYDDLNRLTKSSKPDGQGATVLLVRNEYDGNNNVTLITDANNNSTRHTYTERNQLATSTYMDASSTANTYDAVGNLATETDEALQTQTYTYDAENRLASQTNHAQEVTSYTYDYNGNRLSLSRPKLNGWSYSYDGLNRLQTVANSLADTTTYEYDANDNLTAQIDAQNKRVEYAYDPLNRRTQHTQIKTTGNLVAVFGYDANGNMTSRTDAKNQVFSYTYDELNREITRSYPAESGPFVNIASITTTYDANNNIASITENKSGALGALSDLTSNSYDLLDRQLSSTQRGKTISYAYDKNGNRTVVSTAAGSTHYSYDNRNRIDSALVGTALTDYTYYADGKQQQITYPNGTQTRYAYDDADRVNDIITESSTTQALISRFQYSFDSNGNRSQQLETQNGQVDTTTYSYDSADRMDGYTLVSGASTTSTSYSFDGVSNRLSETVTENTVVTTSKTYAYDDTHWLDKVTDNLKAQDISYSYDNNGNTLQKLDNTQASPQSTLFTYNSRDQLVQTQQGAPTAESTILGQYDYNFAGLRTRHYSSERGNVNYYYDDQAVIEERTDTDTLLAHYRYADRLLSLQTDVETSYYHHDGLGSTSNLTDTTGAVKVSYKLDPWGHIREQIGTSVNRQVFTGQEMDEQTGLVYFGARFYDPDVGRFLNQDSYLGESNTPPSLHRYLYAYANPTYYTDPTGNAVAALAVPPPPVANNPSADSSTCLQFGCEGNNQLALKAENFLKDAASGFMHVAEMFITKGAGFGNRKEDSTEARITTEGEDLHSSPLPQQDEIPSSTSLEHDKSGLDNSREEFPEDNGPQQGTPGFASSGPQSGTSTSTGANQPGAQAPVYLSENANKKDSVRLTGVSKNAKWVKSRQGVDGPGLRDHFEKHGEDVGAETASEFDLSARTTIKKGKEFTYRDRKDGKPRTGYYDAETGLFTATSQDRKNPAILTHYPQTWDELRELPGFTVKK